MKYPETINDFMNLPTVLQDVVINGVPSIDDVLDIRLKISELKDANEDELAKEFFEAEIGACDIVLRVLQQLENEFEK